MIMCLEFVFNISQCATNNEADTKTFYLCQDTGCCWVTFLYYIKCAEEHRL